MEARQSSIASPGHPGTEIGVELGQPPMSPGGQLRHPEHC